MRHVQNRPQSSTITDLKTLLLKLMMLEISDEGGY